MLPPVPFRRKLAARGLGLAVTAVSAGLFCMPHARAADAATTVRFTYQPGTLVTPLIEIAIKEGFFKDLGIKAETTSVTQGPAAATALASSSVDVATNAPEVFLPLAAKGISLKLIAGQTKQISILVARPGLKVPNTFPASMQMLRGKKIGVTALSSATQRIATTLLKAAGLKASDVTFVAVGNGGAQALANRVVDATFVFGPQVVIAQEIGAKPIVDLRSADRCPVQKLNICGIAQIGMWAKTNWIDQHRDAVQKIREAIAKADRFLHDPANAGTIYRLVTEKLPNTTTDKMKKAYVSYVMSVVTAAYGHSDLARWIDLDSTAGVISRRLPVSTVFAAGTPETEKDVETLAQ